MAKESTRRVAGYVRVSTEEQAKEGFSMELQAERIRSYCNARGWELVNIYQDDGYTARNIDRPAYQQLFRDIRNWDVILTLKMDRMHRNALNFMEMMEFLKVVNRDFVSVSDNLDTSTAMGRFAADMIQRLAQLESEQISERVIPAMQIAKEKNLHQGRPPVGFTWVKDEERFELTEWARKIERDVQTMGTTEAGHINPYPEGHILAGKTVSETSVRRILKNIQLFRDGRLIPNKTLEEKGEPIPIPPNKRPKKKFKDFYEKILRSLGLGDV